MGSLGHPCQYHGRPQRHLLDCIDRRVLGDDVDLVITSFDEANTRIKPKQIIRDIQASGGKGLVALVGVQSNRFPRAVDIARPFTVANIPVCIGGFHASGCLSMLPHTPPEIREAIFDRMIKRLEEQGLKFTYIIQVDTLCRQIPNFIENAGRAGVNRVFIGRA